MEPVISVGLVVHNCSQTLPIAIRSILAQTYEKWELVLIDDGSTDTTLEIARQFNDKRIRIYSDSYNLGLAARLNQAIDLSLGKFFARMDGDDVAYPQRFERQLAYLSDNPNVDLVGTSAVVFRGNGELLGARYMPEDHSMICARPFVTFPMIHPTYFGHIEWFKTNRYDKHFSKAQDRELLLRTYRQSRFANVPEILLGYREEMLNLDKLVKSRRSAIRALIHSHGQHQCLNLISLNLIIRAVVMNEIKLLRDRIAIHSGLGYRLLQHRVNSATVDECKDWSNTWQALSV